MPSSISRRGFVRLAAGSLVGLVAATPLAGCAGGTSKSGSGTLKVGVRNDISGFGYFNEMTQAYSGLEIDIAREMATRIGYADIECTAVTPDNRKDTLLNGEVDCLVACYSVSDSREKNFDFSPVYYTDSVVMVAETSSLITKVSDLKGLTIGTMSGANTAPQLASTLVEKGFTNGEAVTANEDNSDVTFDTWHLLQFESYQALSDALEAGTIDAMALDGAIAKGYLDSTRTQLEDFSIADQGYAVATNKDSDLTAKVADAIQAMLDDGTIAGFIDKWD